MTHEELQVLDRIRRTPEGMALLKLLKDRLSARTLDLISCVGENVVRAQGRCIELRDLLHDFENTPSNLARSDGARLRKIEGM